jgi:23S rRNA pseudouridine1911/1915/1917 synthase
LSPKFQTHRVEFPPEYAGKRLDQALAALLPQYSRSRIQGWITDGAVLVNGLAAKSRDKVTGGEAATVEARLPEVTGIKAEKLPLDIVHQDAHIIVLNKPPGVVVHPGAGNPGKTLQNALLAHDPKLKRVPRAGLVHRIDKDTSGLLVVARTMDAQTKLVAELSEHAIEREYLAVCTGVMTGSNSPCAAMAARP